MISWGAILSLTKLAALVRVAEAAVEADAGVAVMAAVVVVAEAAVAGVVAAVAEAAVAGIAVTAAVVVAATGAGNPFSLNSKFSSIETGSPPWRAPRFTSLTLRMALVPGNAIWAMLSLGNSYAHAIRRKRPQRAV